MYSEVCEGNRRRSRKHFPVGVASERGLVWLDKFSVGREIRMDFPKRRSQTGAIAQWVKCLS